MTGRNLRQIINQLLLTYKSKHNLNRENQVILLIITDVKNGIILL